MIHCPVGPWRFRMSWASNKGAPQSTTRGGERAALTIHRVSAVLGDGVADMRKMNPVTPDMRAASESLRLATRSSWRVSPQISSMTAPSASQASASAVTRNALSTVAVRTSTTLRGSSPNSTRPLTDGAPASRAPKSCRTHSSGRRGDTRRARPTAKPVAAAPCRVSGANTSWRTPQASPP